VVKFALLKGISMDTYKGIISDPISQSYMFNLYQPSALAYFP